jgi:hypothetical protein
MPWAVLAHCLFGLWMHTHFKVLGDDSTSSLLGSIGDSSSSSTSSQDKKLSTSLILERISAANGIALLVCAIIIVLWLIFRQASVRCSHQLLPLH